MSRLLSTCGGSCAVSFVTGMAIGTVSFSGLPAARGHAQRAALRPLLRSQALFSPGALPRRALG